MEDVLLPVGTIVEVENHKEEISTYLIIGKRQVNTTERLGQTYHRAWDYRAVDWLSGYSSYKGHIFFDHPEIVRIVKRLSGRRAG